MEYLGAWGTLKISCQTPFKYCTTLQKSWSNQSLSITIQYEVRGIQSRKIPEKYWQKEITIQVEKRTYQKGELNGPAIITWASGDSFEFNYINGKMEVTKIYYNFLAFILTLYVSRCMDTGNLFFQWKVGLVIDI